MSDALNAQILSGLYGYDASVRLRQNEHGFNRQISQLWTRYQLPQQDLLFDYKFVRGQEERDRVCIFGSLPLSWIKQRSVKAMTNCLIIDDISRVSVQQIDNVLYGYLVKVHCTATHTPDECIPYIEIADEAALLLHPIATDLITGGRSWVKQRDPWGQWK